MIRSPPSEPEDSSFKGRRGIIQELVERLRFRFHGIRSAHGVSVATVVASAGKHDGSVHGSQLVERDAPRVPEHLRIVEEVCQFPW